MNTPATIADGPQFQHRITWMGADQLGCEQLAFPLQVIGEELPVPDRAPALGQHTAEVVGGSEGPSDTVSEATHLRSVR